MKSNDFEIIDDPPGSSKKKSREQSKVEDDNSSDLSKISVQNYSSEILGVFPNDTVLSLPAEEISSKSGYSTVSK